MGERGTKDCTGQCERYDSVQHLTLLACQPNRLLRVSKASVGLTFSLLLTDAGFIYACGSSENGQLGNEKEGRRIVGPGRVVYDQQETPRTSLP